MEKNTTICIVDDDEAVRDSMRILVESYGYQVQDYPSATAFLAEGRPGGGDCLVLDLHMPEMDGLELVGELHRRSVRMPTIMVTGHGDDSLAQRARKAEVLALLHKPVAAGELIGWIERAVEQRPAAG